MNDTMAGGERRDVAIEDWQTLTSAGTYIKQADDGGTTRRRPLPLADPSIAPPVPLCLGGERQVEQLLGKPDQVAGHVGLFTGTSVAQEQGGAVEGFLDIDAGFADEYFGTEVLDGDPVRFPVQVDVPVSAGEDAGLPGDQPLKCCHVQFNSFDVHRAGDAGRDNEGVAEGIHGQVLETWFAPWSGRPAGIGVPELAARWHVSAGFCAVLQS